MKVLYLINHAGGGGSEQYVLTLIDKLSKQGVECCFAYNEFGLLAERLAQKNICTFQFKMKNLFDIKAAKTLARICKKNNIDVIHAQYPRENYIALLSKLFYRKTKVVFTNHIILEDVGFVRKVLNKMITRFNDSIICVCNHGKKLLSHNGYPHKKIQVIYNGVDTGNIKEPDIDLRQTLGIDPNAFVICTAARFTHEKGIDFLIDSAKELEGMTSNKVAFLIAGDGELFPQIKRRIKDKNLESKVHLLGYRSDLYNVYAASDLFVCPSRTEALSFALLEAMSYGLPLVATDVGGNSDVINENSNCGLLVTPGNTLALSSAIMQLYEDKPLYENYKQGALACVKDKFSLDITARKTLDIYKNITTQQK